MSDDSAASELGLAIKLRRTRQEITRRDLERLSGLSYPYLAEIENGRKIPSMKALDTIARALKMQASDLQREAEKLSEWGPAIEPDATELPAAMMLDSPDWDAGNSADLPDGERMIREITTRVVQELGPLIQRRVESILNTELRERGLIK